MVKPLNNLNNLKRGSIRGVYKQWIYTSPLEYHKACDYLQKINFSIQDLNGEIECLNTITAKEIVYTISLVDWIIEAYRAIEKAVVVEIIKNFSYSKQSELEQATDFLKALRSYIVAHPLSTNRHKKFGFDGNFICIDIYSGKEATFKLLLGHKEYFYHLDYDGLKEKTYDESDNFFMCSYPQNDNGIKPLKRIGSKVELIYRVAELYIEALYEMDKYLSKRKKADLEDKIKQGGKN